MNALPSTTSRATCERCGAVHEVAVPTPSFLCELCIASEVDAAAARTRRSAFLIIGIGVVMLLLAAVLWSTADDAERNRRYSGRRMPLPISVGIAAVGCIGIGVGKLRFRPKLKL